MTLFTLGEVLAVFLAEDATLAEATRFRRTVAGSEANLAAGVVRLGVPARLVTTVGRDALGDAIARTLDNWGIDAHVSRSDLPTGTLVRDLAGTSPANAVHLRTGSAATEIGASQVNAAWGPGIDAVFVTGITAVRSESARAAVERTVRLARDGGALVVVDPNLRLRLGGHEQFREALSGLAGLIDIAIGDPAELALLTDANDPVSALLDSGCRLVVTKRGADGAVATDGRSEFRVATRATSVVDTVGAGDSFAAGFLAATLQGGSVTDALELGSVVAARVVATAGDTEGLPTMAQIRNELQGAR